MAARLNKKTETVRDLIDHRLKSVAAAELRDASFDSHVDEDTIAAYIEGRLTEIECKPVLAHLAACGLCRRASAQIVKLENQIDADPVTDISAEGPGRLEALLSRLGSAVSVDEDVVFAYQNPDEDEKAAEDQRSTTGAFEGK